MVEQLRGSIIRGVGQIGWEPSVMSKVGQCDRVKRA